VHDEVDNECDIPIFFMQAGRSLWLKEIVLYIHQGRVDIDGKRAATSARLPLWFKIPNNPIVEGKGGMSLLCRVCTRLVRASSNVAPRECKLVAQPDMSTLENAVMIGYYDLTI
jgi:hypothetical protein